MVQLHVYGVMLLGEFLVSSLRAAGDAEVQIDDEKGK